MVDQPAITSLEQMKLEEKLADYTVGAQIGSGAFGAVFVAVNTATEQSFALRVCRKKNLNTSRYQLLVNKQILQASLKHPHILAIKGIFEENEKMLYVLEYAERGDLGRHLMKRGSYSERRTATFIRQLCDALAFCHSRNVIHKNVKPSNILLDKDYNVLLYNFWRPRSPSAYSVSERLRIGGLTCSYKAPEIVWQKPNIDSKADVWAVGVILFQLLTGDFPFADTSAEPLMMLIIKDFEIKFPKSFPSGAKSLVQQLIVSDAAKRIDLTDVLRHPWITKKKTSGEAEEPNKKK